MKKKFFAIYALMGAMAVSPIFTSCVDSEETPSVEALRNAKAEELKAIADLNNAQAASKIALAAADAALTNAKAEAQKAQNKLTEARIAWYETQNESERAALAVTIKQAEADLARIQGEMEAQAIALQAALLQEQQNLLLAKRALEDATKNYDAYEKAKLQNLANAYSMAVNDLIWYQQMLAAEKSNLAKLEAGLVDAKSALEKTIALNNNQIAFNNVQIETLKQYEGYNEDKDALYLEYQAAISVVNVANDKKNAAELAWNKLRNEVDFEAVNEAHDEIYKDEFRQFIYNWNVVVEEDGQNNYYYVGGIAQYFRSTDQYEQNTHKYGEIEYTDYCGQTYSFEYEMTADFRQIELAHYDATSYYKDRINSYNEAIKADQTAYTAAVAATTAAKKAWDEAAEADKAAKKQAYEDALNEELRLKQNIATYQDYVDNYAKWVTIYDKALDMAKNADKYNEALQAKVKAYNDANVAAYAEVLTAWEKYQDEYVVYQEAYTTYYALYNLYWNANDIASAIATLEADNESLQAQIEEAKKLLTQYDGYEMPFEVAIEFQKARVAAREAIVAAWEIKVKEAKEALDAAMPAEEEETPAE